MQDSIEIYSGISFPAHNDERFPDIMPVQSSQMIHFGIAQPE